MMNFYFISPQVDPGELMLKESGRRHGVSRGEEGGPCASTDQAARGSKDSPHTVPKNDKQVATRDLRP